MAEPEKEESIPPKKKRSHWLRYTLIGLLLFFLALFITAFYSFNYFGERILRKFLQENRRAGSARLFTMFPLSRSSSIASVSGRSIHRKESISGRSFFRDPF
jgi:hypothetical protein